MYLYGIKGLAGASRIIMGTVGANLNRENEAANMRRSCDAQGGIISFEPANYSPGMPQVQGMVDNVVCTIPAKVAAAPAPAPAVITVSPVIQSQVSPQVSPSFVQQQQPTNSPVGTRADQTDTTSITPPFLILFMCHCLSYQSSRKNQGEYKKSATQMNRVAVGCFISFFCFSCGEQISLYTMHP